MHKTSRSLRYAASGLLHALKHERNLRLFLLAHLPIIVAGFYLKLSILAWMFILIFGAIFVIVELLNTAMERLADTVDDREKKRLGGHYHVGIKATKDVGAAASLVALSLDIVILVLVFGSAYLASRI